MRGFPDGSSCCDVSLFMHGRIQNFLRAARRGGAGEGCASQVGIRSRGAPPACRDIRRACRHWSRGRPEEGTVMSPEAAIDGRLWRSASKLRRYRPSGSPVFIGKIRPASQLRNHDERHFFPLIGPQDVIAVLGGWRLIDHIVNERSNTPPVNQRDARFDMRVWSRPLHEDAGAIPFDCFHTSSSSNSTRADVTEAKYLFNGVDGDKRREPHRPRMAPGKGVLLRPPTGREYGAHAEISFRIRNNMSKPIATFGLTCQFINLRGALTLGDRRGGIPECQ